MHPPLNWREIETIAAWVSPRVTNLFVDRVIVPSRPEFKEGYLKNEWVIRIASRGKELAFLVSVRPKRSFVACFDGKGPKAALQATRSGFDLTLNKTLSGRRILGLEAVSQERTLILWFEGEPGESSGRYGLVITLIPALPGAHLVIEEGKKLRILASSRKTDEAFLTLPDGVSSPPGMALRSPELDSSENYHRTVRESLASEAFESRLASVRTKLQADRKQVRTRLAQNERTLEAAVREVEYQTLGDLLKGAMGMNPPLSPRNTRKAYDWASETEVEIPCDPKLSLKEQVERFYSLAKRKERRVSEANLRIQTLRERAERIEAFFEEANALAITALREKPPFSDLARIEEALGISIGGKAPEDRSEAKSLRGWDGKVFRSKEGLPILVGRSKDENLELTFKIARGNDLWMHVRGKPGAHAVIPLRSKRNASLETLLDAAYLCIHYSNGADWGKTEVDYTHKKHVKRIRDSSEASYVQNKTLFVELDKERLRELLAQGQ
jgi:predicted ribosome quality control (RQC) complex YloA/Tae2 family protein